MNVISPHWVLCLRYCGCDLHSLQVVFHHQLGNAVAKGLSNAHDVTDATHSLQITPNHKSSPRCLPHWIKTVSIWFSAVYQSAEYDSPSLACPVRTHMNSGFTLLKCLAILCSISFYLFIMSEIGEVGEVALTPLKTASICYFYGNPIYGHLHFK